MVVSWIPLTLSEARGFITSYTVFYSPHVSRRKQQEPNTMQKTVSGDVSQTTIDDLDPNTAYDVQMSANTKAGASYLSEVISVPVPPDTGRVVIKLITILYYIKLISYQYNCGSFFVHSIICNSLYTQYICTCNSYTL